MFREIECEWAVGEKMESIKISEILINELLNNKTRLNIPLATMTS